MTVNETPSVSGPQDTGPQDTGPQHTDTGNGGRDGIVSGTAGHDMIDAAYTGDPDGDRIDSGEVIRPGAGPYDDLIEAGDGDDTVFAGIGNDTVYGGAGDDHLFGKEGDDLLYGEAGDDILSGGEGDDTLYGGDGDDLIFGDQGNDILIGGAGADTLHGGDGRDLFLGVTPGDVIDGGEGGDDFDTLDLRDSGPLTVSFDSDNPENGTITFLDAEGAATGTARFINIEHVILPEENTAPVANPDAATTDEDTPVIIDVLANDSDPDGDPLTVTAASAEHGTVAINPDGTLTYTPDPDYNGPDQIAYTVADGQGGSSSSTVAVMVAPVNDAPVANPDAAATAPGAPVTVLVLENDSDVDGDVLSVTGVTASPDGTVAIGPDGGSVIFTPNPGFTGETVIGYTISDGQGGFASSTVTITVGDMPAPGLDGFVQGSDGDDLIDAAYTGDPQGDRIDAGDALLPGQGPQDDIVLAGDGNDTVYAGAGDDLVFGDGGDDLIYGGDGDDVLIGGAGDDTLSGGAGADLLFGGAGNDLFIDITPGDFIDGGDDIDTLDLRGAAGPGGSLNVVYDENPQNGTVTFRDAEGDVTGTARFVNIENVVPCFTPGTAIATARGERLVEELRVGDRIITRDNGFQEIRWIGAKTLGAADLAHSAHLRPILIRRGALGDNLPERDMLVSPNHRLLVSNEKTALYFEEPEVLAAAKHLIGASGIQEAGVGGTTYLHFMFDRHEVVLSNGCWTESFQPGDYTLRGIGNAQRAEIMELFPELKTEQGLEGYQTARRSLKRHEAMLLAR